MNLAELWRPEVARHLWTGTGGEQSVGLYAADFEPQDNRIIFFTRLYLHVVLAANMYPRHD